MVLPVWAKQIDPSDAKDVASKFVRKTTRLKSLAGDSDPLLVYTASTGSVNNFYVYNLAKGGFVIVAADDCVEQVLGYSENGSFNINAIPENMRYMLDEYTKEINFAIEHSQDVVTPGSVAFAATEMATERAAVPPLLTTKWNQESPFNDKCPMYDNERRCATGCTATAMAQIMNYFEWPKTGQGSNSYNQSINGNTMTLSVDFSDVTFDWDNMLDVYYSSATDAQNDAVATLMYCAGVSANMEYGLSSGASSLYAYQAFLRNFDYDKSLRYIHRWFYSPNEWNDLLYNEVANGRPVLYAGYNSRSGHAFVCDGYSSDNLFHINWGWGGMSDGYFRLSALNPTGQGVGGSDSGYNGGQEIIYGFAPNKGTTDISVRAGTIGDFTCTTTSVAASDVASTTIAFNGGIIYDRYCNELEFGRYDEGVDVVNDDTNQSTFILCEVDLNTRKLQCSASSFAQLGDGNYTIYPAFINTTYGISGRTMVPYGCQNAVKLTVSNGALTFSDIEPEQPEITIDNIEIEAKLYLYGDFKINFKVSNTGADFFDEIFVGFIKDGEMVRSYGSNLIEICKGETVTASIIGRILVDAGEYLMEVYTKNKNGERETKASVNVTVNETQHLSLELVNEGFTFDEEIDCNDFNAVCRVSNVGAVIGTNYLALICGNDGDGNWNSYAKLLSDYYIIDTGETKEIKFSGSFDGIPGNNYYIYLYYLIGSSWQQMGSSTKFTLPYKSGIDDVVANLINEGFAFDDEINCRDFRTTCRVTNTGDAVGGSYFAELYSVGNDDELLFKQQLNSVSCVINKNATKELTFTSAFFGDVGQEYAVCLFFNDGNEKHQLGKETRFILTKNEEPGLVNKGFTFDNEINCLDFNAVCRVTNTGKKVEGDFYAEIYDNEGYKVASFVNESCVIDKNETKDIEFSGAFYGVVGQEYCIYIVFVKEGETAGYQVGDITKFIVTKNESGLINEGFTFDEEIDCSDFKATCRVTNKGEKVEGYFFAYIYDNEQHKIASFANESCVIDKNETKELTFTGKFDGVVGQEYNIYLYTTIANVWQKVGGGTKFTLTGSSGIDDVVADAVNGVVVYPNPSADVAYVESGSAMGNIAVYSLSGQQVLATNAAGERRVALQVVNLQSGVYVVKVSTEQGEIVRRLSISRSN